MKIGYRYLLLKRVQVPLFVFYANAVEVGLDPGPVDNPVFDKYRAGIVIGGQTARIRDANVLAPVVPVPGTFIGDGDTVAGGVIEPHVAAGV